MLLLPGRVMLGIERVKRTIAASCMMVVMLVIFCDVFARYVFNAPLVWTYELVGMYLMPALFYLTYAMSKERFDRFPENVQKAMLDAGKKASRNVCEFLDGSAVSNRTRIEAAGVKHFKLNDADLKKLAEASNSARKEWAAQLDRRSLPGSEVLEAYLNALEP